MNNTETIVSLLPPKNLDLRNLPCILIGADPSLPLGAQHRYVNDSEYQNRIFPHNDFIPRQPGGSAYGCSRAHLQAANTAMEKYSNSVVFLLEDDAVMTDYFNPILKDIPEDADIIWVGRSVDSHNGEPSPKYIKNPDNEYQLISGVCQATHSVLLLTEKGKQVWKYCCESCISGNYNGYTDLGCSLLGHSLCKQYTVVKPLFHQPDHPITTLILEISDKE